MKKTVKCLALLLVAAMMIGMFTGCGPKDSGPAADPNEDISAKDFKDIEFRVAWWGDDGRHTPTMDAIEEFDKLYTNLKTAFTYSGWGEFFPQIIDIQLAGHTAPDVIQMTREKLPAYSQYNLLKLDDFIASGALDTTNVTEDDLQMGAFGDGIYGIATGTNCTVYVYTTADVAAAGVTLSRTPTLDEYVAAAKAVYAATGKKAYFEFADYVRMQGESYYNEDGTAVAFSADVLVDWWLFERQAIKDGWLVGPNDGIDGGKTGAIMGKIWSFSTYSNQIISCEKEIGQDLEWTAIPSTEKNKTPTYIQPNTLWVINKETKNPALAVALLNFFTNNTAYFDSCGYERGMAISSVIRDYMEPKMGESEALQKEIVETLRAANAFGDMPNVSVNDGAAKTELSDYMQQNGYHDIDPETYSDFRVENLPVMAQQAIDDMNSVLAD